MRSKPKAVLATTAIIAGLIFIVTTAALYPNIARAVVGCLLIIAFVGAVAYLLYTAFVEYFEKENK